MKSIKIQYLLILLLGLLFAFKPSTKYDYLITLSSSYGDMKIILFDDTPIHKENFINNIQNGVYEGSTFHRVINSFMIQGGAPVKKIFSDTASFEEKTIPNEIMEKHKHVYGALAAARTGNPEKRSDKTQFYIVQNKNGSHSLDNRYTVFGQVMVGYEVIDKIAAVEVEGSKPKEDVKFSLKAEKVKRKDMVKFYGDIYKP